MGDWLGQIAVALGAFAFVAAIPPLEFGFWPDNSGPLLAIRLAGALGWIALGLVALRPGERNRMPAIGVALGGLGLFGCALTLLHPVPALSLAGSPVFGDGPVWWLCVAALAACAARIAAEARGRFLLGAIAMGSIAVEGAFHLAPFLPDAFAPYNFSKVMGWAVLAAVAIAAAGRFDSARARALLGVCILAMAGFVWFDNARALLIAVIVFGVMALVLRIVTGDGARKSLALVFLAIATLHPVLFTFDAIHADLADLSGVGGQLLGKSLERPLLHRFEYWWTIALDIDFATATASAWIGHGWGGVADAFARQHLGLGQMAHFAADGAWRPNMIEGAERFTVHSHNMMLEAWHGGGAIFMTAFAGLAALWLSPMARRASVSVCITVAMLTYASVWYMAPAHIGLFAVALGVMASGRMIVVPAAPAMAGCFAVLLVGVGVAEARRSIALDDVAQAVATEHGAATEMAALIDADPVGVHMHEAVFITLGAIEATEAVARPTLWRDFEILWAELEGRIAAGDGPDRLALGALVARGHILDPDSGFSPPPEFAATLRASWFDAAYAVTAEAPARQDLVGQALGDLVLRARFDALGRNSARLLARNADDPIGLWFAGLAQITGEERGAGFARMARALDLGVGRFFPVTPETAAEVRRSAAAFAAGR